MDMVTGLRLCAGAPTERLDCFNCHSRMIGAADEIERLRDENRAAWDSAEYNARRARVAEAAIERMREYAEHDAECQGQPGYDIPCSCGYDELMKGLEETK